MKVEGEINCLFARARWCSTNNGTPIELHFMNPAGPQMMKLLPARNQKDEIDGMSFFMTDYADPCVFVKTAPECARHG